MRGLAITSIYLLIGAGIITYAVYSGTFAALGQRAAPETISNDVIMHIHPRLEILIDGQQIPIPANIGIDPNLWKNHTLERYGMPMSEICEMPYMSPLHTHDTSGVMHLESTVNRIYTLGEFFDVWGVRFNESCILDRCSDNGTMSMLVNGVKNSEFRSHILKDGEQIRIEFRKR